MTLTKQEEDFLAALSAGLAGKAAALEGTDYGALFAIAGQQKLLPFVYEALHESITEETAPLFAQAKARARTQVLGQTLRSADFRELYGEMRRAGLRPVVVKGQLCGGLYPRDDFRLSGDDDLWLPEEEMEPCHRFLTDRGLVTDALPEERAARGEITYRDPRGSVYLEIHRRLFEPERGGPDLNGFFAEALRRPVELRGFLSMAPGDHLLYLILHAFKHFVARGVGIRQLCDMGLWAAAYRDAVDWAALYERCRRIRSQDFAAAAFGVCRTYLGMDLDLPTPWDRPVSLEPLCHDALSGGIYGSADGDRLRASTLTLQAASGGKKLPLATLFPPRSSLVDRFPYLRRRPWLLPWAWLRRLTRYAAEDHKNNSPAGAVKLARQRVTWLRQYGVIEQP